MAAAGDAPVAVVAAAAVGSSVAVGSGGRRPKMVLWEELLPPGPGGCLPVVPRTVLVMVCDDDQMEDWLLP